MKLQFLLVLLTACVTFASKEVAQSHILRADDAESENEIEEKSDYEQAGTNFNAFNYGFKGNTLLSGNFSTCGLQILQWSFLEMPAYSVKSRYAEGAREQVYNATMFAQNTSEMLEWCTRVTHDVQVSYSWKIKAFGGWGGYASGLIQNLLGNAIRIEAINEKLADNQTSEVYKWFYQGRLANVMLNFTPPAEVMKDDYQTYDTVNRLMSIRNLAQIFQSNPKLTESEENPIVVEGEAVIQTEADVAEEGATEASEEAEEAASQAEEEADAISSQISDEADMINGWLTQFIDLEMLLSLRGLLTFWKGANIGSQILDQNTEPLLMCDNVITLGYLDQWDYATQFSIRQNMWIYFYSFYAMMFNSYDLSVQCINYGDSLYGNVEAVLKRDLKDKRRVILNSAFNYQNILLNKNRVMSFWTQRPIEQMDGSMTTVGDSIQDYYNAGYAAGRILFHVFMAEPILDTQDPVSSMAF